MEDATALGLIPAHAGKTTHFPARRRPGRAHPRSRGENAIVVGMVREGMGSSPLTRGKQRRRQVRTQRARLIPAHAGKTLTPAGQLVIDGAHPRSRGENTAAMRAPNVGLGSSPLTRGKRSAKRRGRSGRGLIPAHAGKTSDLSESTDMFRAHPRSRGENINLVVSALSGWGSSPLTRGKLSRARSEGTRSGLIPAHAGKTDAAVTNAGHGGAHPRSRGENRRRKRRDKRPAGSSPLTRGKPLIIGH